MNGLIGKISEMRTGIVKFFNDIKGFGFIIDDTTHSEYFIHVTNLEDDIYRGSKVGYEIGIFGDGSRRYMLKTEPGDGNQ